MDRAQLTEAFEAVFDHALIFHGFADYLRDYDLYIYTTAADGPDEYLRYRFKYCVRADVTSAVPPDVWRVSLDERLVDKEIGPDLAGYVWGVRWQVLYPGLELVPESAEADRWARELGLPFFEATVGTNGHTITLVFADLTVERVEPGLAPFVVG